MPYIWERTKAADLRVGDTVKVLSDLGNVICEGLVDDPDSVDRDGGHWVRVAGGGWWKTRTFLRRREVAVEPKRQPADGHQWDFVPAKDLVEGDHVRVYSLYDYTGGELLEQGEVQDALYVGAFGEYVRINGSAWAADGNTRLFERRGARTRGSTEPEELSSVIEPAEEKSEQPTVELDEFEVKPAIRLRVLPLPAAPFTAAPFILVFDRMGADMVPEGFGESVRESTGAKDVLIFADEIELER